MYSKYNKENSVVAEKFVRILKNKIYKYVTPVSKNVSINKLDAIVNKYNNTYHSTSKMKPVDVKSNGYIDSSKEINNKDPKFIIGDIVRISKHKYIFAKGYTPNCSVETFVITEVKNTVLWIYVIDDLKEEEINGTFYEKELQKPNQKKFRIEKVIKRRVTKYMLNRKDIIIRLIAGQIKQISYI